MVQNWPTGPSEVAVSWIGAVVVVTLYRLTHEGVH
jgi:hypothetical protein